MYASIQPRRLLGNRAGFVLMPANNKKSPDELAEGNALYRRVIPLVGDDFEARTLKAFLGNAIEVQLGRPISRPRSGSTRLIRVLIPNRLNN